MDDLSALISDSQVSLWLFVICLELQLSVPIPPASEISDWF